MTKPIIEINGIGKRYNIGHREKYLSLRDEIVQRISPAARRARQSRGHFWALKDVSFCVDPGEAVGIVGSNGAGKSTLLKILSKITPPTEGHIVRRGRVASLLEVGTGFHPELTGRENIYLNGAILGMTRKEIASKFDEIVAFSEIEQFLETPVKRYSSGMFVRLAFAVAAHLEPEILVIDEVLAVGDVDFQKKCLGKMDDVAKSGRTVLFVSHNLAAVQQLCVKGIVLQKGSVVFSGTSAGAVEHYTQIGGGQDGEIVLVSEPVVRPPDKKAALLRIRLEDASGKPSNVCLIGEPLVLSFDIEIFEPIGDFQFSFVVNSSSGLPIYDCYSQDSRRYFDGSKPGRYQVKAVFPQNKLYPGKYFLDEFWFARKDGDCFDWLCQPLTLIVPDTNNNTARPLRPHKGLIYELPEWEQNQAPTPSSLPCPTQRSS